MQTGKLNGHVDLSFIDNAPYSTAHAKVVYEPATLAVLALSLVGLVLTLTYSEVEYR